MGPAGGAPALGSFPGAPSEQRVQAPHHGQVPSTDVRGSRRAAGVPQPHRPRTHACTHMISYRCGLVLTLTPMHTHAHALAYKCTLTRKCILMCTHLHSHTSTQSHIRVHIQAHHMSARLCTRSRVHTHEHACTHERTPSHTCTQAHILTCVHSCSLSHAHTCTRPTLILRVPSSPHHCHEPLGSCGGKSNTAPDSSPPAAERNCTAVDTARGSRR